MKNLKSIIGCILVISGFVGMIVCVIAACVFMFQNPDMTAMRRFLEYPEPSVWCIVNYIGVKIGRYVIKNT